MSRPGSAPAMAAAMRRASHSRDAELVSLMTSLASTGMAAGLLRAGRRTMTAATIQLLSYPVFAGPGAEPSWNHDAAHTFLPRLRNKVSSIATVTGSPAGTSSATTSWATARPSWSGFQRAREKNRCARSWLQEPARPAPASIPHTVRFPVCARNPQARPQNVRNDGAVNNGARPASSVISDAGTGSVASASIGGNPFHRRFHKHRRCSLLPRPRLPQLTESAGHAACRRAAASRTSRAMPGTPCFPQRTGRMLAGSQFVRSHADALGWFVLVAHQRGPVAGGV